MGSNFQVDLAGVVDLLSRHLYSSPQVYLRELVQNAVDAVVARSLEDEQSPRRIVVTPADVAADGCLHVEDTGIGLDRAAMLDVLATIGRSSKRDEIGFARQDFIGQFGIGLLSAFLVTDVVELTTLAVGGDETLLWRGRADGTYEIGAADQPRSEPGTHVVIRPRTGESELVSTISVEQLLTTYAAHLPCELVLRVADGERTLNRGLFPWEDRKLAGLTRRSAAVELCHDLLGFAPLDVIEISDPASGTSGFAYVTAEPTARTAHRVYAKHMLLSESCAEILPDWAFFVRAVVNTDALSPTASRESLFEDDALAAARDRIGEQLQRWLVRIATTEPDRMRAFMRVHHLGAKAMAVRDKDMLRIVATWVLYETTDGSSSLLDFAERGPVLRYCDDVDDFSQLSQLSGTLDFPVLNAGYAYDAQILDQLASIVPELDTQRVTPSDLTAHFDALPAADLLTFQPLLDIAHATLDRAGCRIEVRGFQPASAQAVLLSDRLARWESDRAQTMGSLDGVWSDLLGALEQRDARPAFILNAGNPTIRNLATTADPDVQRLALEALYAHALITGRHHLRPVDTALLTRALPALIDRAIAEGVSDDH